MALLTPKAGLGLWLGYRVRVRVRVRVFCLCLALLFTSGNLLSFGSVKISGMINTETMCIRGVSEVRLWFRVQGIE